MENYSTAFPEFIEMFLRSYLQCNNTVLSIKSTLLVEPCIISQLYITNQLEYVTKDHLATHTLLFKLKMALFFSFLVV